RTENGCRNSPLMTPQQRTPQWRFTRTLPCWASARARNSLIGAARFTRWSQVGADGTGLCSAPSCRLRFSSGRMAGRCSRTGPKELPCDALVYLGTGYCTNGWNTGHGSLAFNPNAFVPENIKSLHDLNFKVILHVNQAPRNLFGTSIVPRAEGRPTPNPSQEG